MLNTGKTTAAALEKLYNMPKNTAERAGKIKRSVQKVSKAAKYTGSVIKKIIQSSTGKYLAVIILVFIIIQLVITGFMSLSMTLQNSFSWLADDNDISRNITDVVKDYEKIIKDYVSRKESEIEDIYYNFECDRREYDGTEITEFRTDSFNIDDMKIDIKNTDRYAQVLAVCAVQRYRQLDNLSAISDNEFPQLKFTDENIHDIIDRFYKFEHGTRKGSCPHYDCCCYGDIMTDGDVNDTIWSSTVWYCDVYYHGCREITEWVQKYENSDEWNWDTVWSGSRTFCDNTNHEYLTGNMENYSCQGVMYKLSFTEKEKELYNIYYEQLKIIFEEMQK
ncbi:MAG TPA: hypothetical protein DCS38_00445 [Ruminococcus sp.]|nr:hypothetical protein [Ruminococcus sp.]